MNNLYYNPKKLKKIRSKRTQKTRRVWGGILTGMGGIELISALTAMSASDLTSAIIFLIPGLTLLIYGTRKVRRWNRYEAIIDNHGNTSISLIAKKMNLSERTVYSDLQEMIYNDFFIGENYNIEAYIDAERNMLVMTSGGQPLRPVPDLPEKEKAAGPAGKTAAEPAPETVGKAGETEEIREEKLSDLELIRQAITDTGDDEVRSYLYGLEGSVRRIDERLEARPELMEKVSIRRLYKYYLPQIMELIRKYHAPETPEDLRGRIKDALKTSADALANIEADLLEREQMDAEVNIEALKNMFAQDGLLSRNQTAKAGQAGHTAKAGQAASSSQAAQAQPR